MDTNKHKFRVRGYGMVPIEVVIDVDASNPREAMELAKAEFDRYPLTRFNCVERNTEDISAVHSFEPREAIQLEGEMMSHD